MPPKKKAAAAATAKAKAKTKASAKAEPVPADTAMTMTDTPATETAEPPKHDAQPAKGDLKANAADHDHTGETTEEAKSASDDDVANTDSDATAKDPVSKKIANESSKPTKKRKNAAEPKKPAKVPREGSRSSARSRASKSHIQPQQMLKYLLSTDAEEMLRPSNETEDLKDNSNKNTYSSAELNPFQELMCAMILSRPINHALGHRTIRTILNHPYNFKTPKAVKDAGEEKVTQAFYDAKTQHKDKTAAQVYQLAETVLEKYTSNDDKEGTKLKKVLSDNADDVNLALKSLKGDIKGFGDTGVDIFLRRVQWQEPWTAAYPFVDGKSQDALRELGLPQDHNELKDLLDEHWSKLNVKLLPGKDNDQKKRRALVMILERATTAELENKRSEVKEAAAKSS